MFWRDWTVAIWKAAKWRRRTCRSGSEELSTLRSQKKHWHNRTWVESTTTATKTWYMSLKLNLKTSPIRGQACCCKSSPRCSANFRRAVSSFSSPEELGWYFPRFSQRSHLEAKHLEPLKNHQAFHNLTLAVSYLTGRLDLTKRGWMLFGGLVCGGCGGFSWWHLIEKSLGIGKELRQMQKHEQKQHLTTSQPPIQNSCFQWIASNVLCQKASWNFVSAIHDIIKT